VSPGETMFAGVALELVKGVRSSAGRPESAASGGYPADRLGHGRLSLGQEQSSLKSLTGCRGCGDCAGGCAHRRGSRQDQARDHGVEVAAVDLAVIDGDRAVDRLAVAAQGIAGLGRRVEGGPATQPVPEVHLM